MGQLFDTARDQMNNWRWNNPCAFRDQVDCSNLQTTSSGKVKLTTERSSWYGSNYLRAMIETPSCWQYKPDNFLAVGPLNWDETIDKDDDDENVADPGVPSTRKSHPGDHNDNDDSEGEEDTQGGERGTGPGKGTKDGNGKWKATEDGKGKGKRKGKGKGNGKGRGVVERTPGGDDISRPVALQLQRKCQTQTCTPRAN